MYWEHFFRKERKINKRQMLGVGDTQHLPFIQAYS